MAIFGGRSSTDAPRVGMWLTTADQSQLLSPQPPQSIRAADAGLPTIAIDQTRDFQMIEGFGASITESSARVITASPNRGTIMRSLFDRTAGIGLSYLRQPIGASDFVAGSHYTYDDIPANETDFNLTHFSIDRDRTEIIPLLRQARELNPDLKVMATPWSPPAWMKTNSSLIGGQLKDDEAIYRAYTQYLVRFVQEYTAAGVPITALSVQNEPQNRHPIDYPGMNMPAHDQIRLIQILGPALHAARLHTQIIAYDHNWAVHPDEDPNRLVDRDYPGTVLSDPQARQYITAVGYHCYTGDPSAQSELHRRFPHVGIYLTECSRVVSQVPGRTFRDTLRWQARNTIGAIDNWAQTSITWNLALNAAHGPHNGGCATCTGVLTVDGGQATRNAEYYLLGHLSKFLDPGAVHIASTHIASTETGTLPNVAFHNPDGTIVLLVLNDSNAGESRFTVRTNAGAFSATLPAGAIATFVVHPGQHRAHHGRQTPSSPYLDVPRSSSR